ncbi:hypothetical protein ACIBF1_04205 [Spirillospora sp. NPDC050679]
MVTTMVLAQAAAAPTPGYGNPTGVGVSLLFGPLVVALALVTWLSLVGFASWPGAHPPRGYDQSPHRGPVEGGMYHYRPGMFSHSDVDTATRTARTPRAARTAKVTEAARTTETTNTAETAQATQAAKVEEDASAARPTRSPGATRL